MKPFFAKILNSSGNEIYATKHVELSHFITDFHFHEEAQLNYIVESEGRRMIGDSVESFYSDELTLLGANLPHVWHNDNQLNSKSESEIRARSITLFFHPEKVACLLSKVIDTTKLENIFTAAQRGMLFYGTTKEKLKELLFEISNSTEWRKLSLLLQVFETLCNTTEYKLLASAGYNNTYRTKDNNRINTVLKFIFDNYATDVELERAADIIHMNKQAFCRYFKSRTQKTFISFVNEVRIAQACKLIAQDDDPISTIAYLCGYKSLSNFNRFFKDIKGMTPKEYKKKLAQMPGKPH